MVNDEWWMMNGFLLDGVCNPAFAGRGLQPRPKRFNKMTPVLPMQNNLFQSINSID